MALPNQTITINLGENVRPAENNSASFEMPVPVDPELGIENFEKTRTRDFTMRIRQR
jgi:hypothetical protein